MHRLYGVNYFLEILNAMFAKRAFEIVGEEIAFINVTANLAFPAAFAIFRLVRGNLWLGFDVVLVIVVGHRWLVGKQLGIQHIGDEHGVRAEVDAFADTASQIGVGVFGDVKHMVHGSMFGLAIGEFVHASA